MTGRRSVKQRIISQEVLPLPTTMTAELDERGPFLRNTAPVSWRFFRCSETGASEELRSRCSSLRGMKEQGLKSLYADERFPSNSTVKKSKGIDA
jgi:hypothetical protein